MNAVAEYGKLARKAHDLYCDFFRERFGERREILTSSDKTAVEWRSIVAEMRTYTPRMLIHGWDEMSILSIEDDL